MNLKKKTVIIIMAIVLVFANVSVASAAESHVYQAIKQGTTKTYNLKTDNTIKSKYISFTPCKGTVSDYFLTKWEKRAMMYSITIRKSNGKIYKQFTWNANNVKKGTTWKVTLAKNTKYKGEILEIKNQS